MIRTISIFILVSLFLWNSFPSTSVAGEKKHPCKWEYTVENNIEKSTRYYLLASGEKRITVESKCSKEVNTEGKYGTCIHNIEIQPTKKITLNTGEDVVIVNTSTSTWDTLLLGTISYGCCGGYHLVRFYTEQGKYMGKFSVEKLHNIGGNVITTIYDFANSAWDNENRGYFVVEDEEDSNKYYAWFKELKKEPAKLPISYSIPEKYKCSGWFMRSFGTYAGRGITMIQEARSCDTTNAQEQEFSCSKDRDKITCSPTVRRSVLQY